MAERELCPLIFPHVVPVINGHTSPAVLAEASAIAQGGTPCGWSSTSWTMGSSRVQRIWHAIVLCPCAPSSRAPQALESFRKAYRLRERVLGSNHSDTASCLVHMGRALLAMGRVVRLSFPPSCLARARSFDPIM